MTTRYIKVIADIPEEEKQLWSDLAFNLRSYTQRDDIEDWESWFKSNTYLYVVIDSSQQTYAYSTMGQCLYPQYYAPLTLEILQTLNLLKLTGG